MTSVAIQMLRDAIFGNPPTEGYQPSREGVVAAIEELESDVGAAVLAETAADVAAAAASAAAAAISAAAALQAAVQSQGAVHILASPVSTGGALPFEVTALSGAIAGTGSGGTQGEYALTVTGGPVGHSAFITIGSDGRIASARIGQRGIATTNTAPTYALPTGTGLTGGTLPTGTVTALAAGRIFLAPSADGSQLLGWQSSAGVIAPWNVNGTQYSVYLKSGVDQVIANFSGLITEIQTDAFAMTVVDKNGYLISLLDNNFIEQSPNQTYLLDLMGHAFIETDAFVYSIIDSNGYLIDALVVSGSTSYWISKGTVTTTVDPKLYVPAGNYLLAAIYGQSVFTGPATTAISTTAYSGGGLLMFNAGTGPFDFSNPANLASLVAAREGVSGSVESAARGVGEGFAQFFNSEAGYAATVDGVNLILSVGAEGGKSASDLSSGGLYFPRLTAMVDALDTLARNAGGVPDVVHLVYCQGEQDINLGTAPNLWISQLENGIRLPFQNYCQTKFGRKTRVKMIMTQVASHEYYGFADPAIARQVLDLCNSNSDYVLAGAMYQYRYGAGGVGSHLYDATEMKWAAAMAGRALERSARGVAHKWINPVRAWQDGPRNVIVEYDVPVGPLVIDTVNVSDPGQKGFNLYSGSSEVLISNVSVIGLNRRSVLLTASSDIPAGVVRVDYAHKGGTTGVAAGRLTGSRGCLRDSDSAIFDPSGINKPLFNWAPIHRIFVG